VCAHPDVQSEDEMEEQAIIRVVVIVREQGIGRWQVQALRVWSTPPSYAAELVRRQEALSTNCALSVLFPLLLARVHVCLAAEEDTAGQQSNTFSLDDLLSLCLIVPCQGGGG